MGFIKQYQRFVSMVNSDNSEIEVGSICEPNISSL